MAAQREAAPRRGEFVWVHRHQRARADRGGTAQPVRPVGRRRSAPKWTWSSVLALSVAFVGSTGGVGAELWNLVDLPSGGRPGGRMPHGGNGPLALRTSCRAGRGFGAERSRQGLGRVGREPAATRRVARRTRQSADDGVVVHRSGQSVSGDGPRVVRRRAGFRRDRETLRGHGGRHSATPVAGGDIRDRPGDRWRSRRNRCGTRRLLNRRCLLSRWVWPGCGSPGASSPTWCWGTASASTRRHAWPESSASRTAYGLMAERGRLFGSLPEGGRMVAVFADPKRVDEVASEFPRVSVGAYNGPNTVLSGPGEDLEPIVAKFSEDGDPLHVAGNQPRLPLGIAGSGARRIRVVRSADAIRRPDIAAGLQPHRRGAHGSHPDRRGVLAAAFPPAGAVRRKCSQHSSARLLDIDGTRSAAGADRRRGAGLAGAPGRPAGDRLTAQGRWRPPSDRRCAGRRLTSAAIDRTSLRCNTGRSHDSNCPPIRSSVGASGRKASGITAESTVPLCPESWVAAKDLASGDSVYTSRLSVKSQPWLSDHVIYGTIVVPGATYAAMALAAVGAPGRVKEVFFYEPIILPEKASREVQLTLHPIEDGDGWNFQVHSRPYGVRDVEWSLNADGTVVAGVGDEPAPDAGPHRRGNRADEPHASAGAVRDLRRHGAVVGAQLVRLAEVAVAR